MHKKLEADLISLAHSILKMKNKDDVFALKEMSKSLYEKLSVLAFVEEYINVTPNLNTTKEALIDKVTTAFASKDSAIESKNLGEEINEIKEERLKPQENTLKPSEVTEEILEQPFDELEEIIFSEENTSLKEPITAVSNAKKPTLEEELQDTISVDVMADLFENARPKSLNDKFAANIQIGLNDRIAFVKYLFNGKQEDYNRVISQLNTFKTEKEAKTFITSMVKPDYNWSEHEELEIRFLEIIERKFA